MSLRWRIALGLALIAALVCAHRRDRRVPHRRRDQLENSIDDSLLGRAATFANRALRAGRPAIRRPDPPTGRAARRPGAVQPAAAAQVVDGRRHRRRCASTARSTCPVDATRPRDRPRRRRRRGCGPSRSTARATACSPSPWRDGGALQTARSLDETEYVLSSLRLRLLAAEPRRDRRRRAARLGCSPGGSCARSSGSATRPSGSPAPRTSTRRSPRPAAARSAASPASFSTMVDALAVSKRQQQQLVTDASHELRTPLTSLRTNAELLDRAGAARRRAARSGPCRASGSR